MSKVGGLFSKSNASESIAPPSSLLTRTPGFSLGTTNTAPGKFFTNLQKLGSTAQDAQAQRFPRILGDIDTLRGTLTPGFSDLRAARGARIESARGRTIGNLRTRLAQRRVLGSSFGEQTLVAAERDFAEAQAEQEAQSFLEELDANTRLLAFETAQINDALNLELQELGIAAGQGAQLAALNSQVAQFAAQLRAQESASAKGALGGILGLGLGVGLTPLGIGGLGNTLIGKGLSGIGGFFGGGPSPVNPGRLPAVAR